MMSDGNVVAIDNGPLCPLKTGPVTHPLHMAFEARYDAACAAAPRDENGETIGMEDFYEQDRMNLYRHSWSGLSGWMGRSGELVRVESWYWHCQVCAFVLPAQASQ